MGLSKKTFYLDRPPTAIRKSQIYKEILINLSKREKI
jgi:hypothetical protein